MRPSRRPAATSRRAPDDVSAPILDALRRRRRVSGRVALVAAHPDDETIGAGASLHLFENLLLVHVTDGAPRNLADARAAGFVDAQGYARARRAELLSALQAGRADPTLVELHAPDQGASACMAELSLALAALFSRHATQAVLTHPYEGGHPDHDATACAVHRAARRSSPALSIVEFASYHADGQGGIATGGFLPNGSAATAVALTPAEQAAKRRMLGCFATQRATLAPFGVAQEAFRAAPEYDFSQPPHPGALHYERYDWGMTGEAWRALAAA